MPKPLRPFGDLLRLGWTDFTKQWNQTVLIASWLLIVPLLFLAIILLSEGIPQLAANWLLITLNILQALTTLWITVRIVKWFLAELHKDDGHAHEHEAIGALKALPGLLWVTILKSLAILGGLVLAIFPGIWLNILFNTAELAYLEDRQKGVFALQFSANLAKNRWWAVFGRMFGMVAIWVLVYFGVYITLSFLVFAISGINVDPSQLTKLLTDPSMTRQIQLLSATDNIIHSVCQIILIPLLFAWQIRLYKNLKESR